MYQQLDQSWLWHSRLTLTAKRSGWLLSNLKVKVVSTREHVVCSRRLEAVPAPLV